MKELKICIILTGGTIGSTICEKEINIHPETGSNLLNAYKKENVTEQIDFDIKIPFQSLSENFSPEQWEQLCNTLQSIKLEQYKGIIITHGSDTLSYTSALIGMLFAHTPIPIILIASNYPLEHPKSNGFDNFKYAIEVIKSQTIKGVFTLFQNNKRNNILYLSTRLMESDSYTDQFSSFGGVPFGEVKEGKIQPYTAKHNPNLLEVNKNRTMWIQSPIKFKHPILLLRAYPGLDYRYINLSQRPKAILHYLYHSATGCTAGEQYNLTAFIKKCKKKEIPVYVASLKESEQKNYVTANEILEAGGIPLYNISLEAAYMKLWIAYNQQKIAVEDVMNYNLYFEQLPQ